MKKLFALTLAFMIITSGMAYAAKYKVNTSGTVKTKTGVIISPVSNVVNQNYYNNYSSQNYIAANQVNSGNVGIVEIVMDYSGSMSNWIGVAKCSMTQILSQIPASTKVGFRVFGHDYNGNNPNSNSTLRQVKKIVKQNGKYKVVTESSCLGSTSGACGATAQVAPITTANTNSLLAGMNSVNLGGATPLVYALDRTVYQDFMPFGTTTPKKIVLITDGGENCGGDPCAFARQLMSKRSDVTIDVVLVSSSSRALACLSSTTGGKFYTVRNLSDFSNTITDSLQSSAGTQPQTKEQKYEFINE